MENRIFRQFGHLYFVVFLGLATLLCPSNAFAGDPVESSQILRIGSSSVSLVTFESSKQGPLYVHLHQDERTAITAAQRAVTRYGGRFLRLESTGERHISFLLSGVVYKFDPNRMFSRKGIRASLTKYGAVSSEAVEAVSVFAATVLSVMGTDADHIVAMHNNTADRYSLKSYRSGGIYASDAQAVFAAPGGDSDDFVFTTHSGIFRSLQRAGVSVVLQDNANATDDGSLSVWCGNHSKSYVNVEAQHGHLRQQLEMLDTLQNVLAGL